MAVLNKVVQRNSSQT